MVFFAIHSRSHVLTRRHDFFYYGVLDSYMLTWFSLLFIVVYMYLQGDMIFCAMNCHILTFIHGFLCYSESLTCTCTYIETWFSLLWSA